MTKFDTAWIVPFLDDLREVAENNGLPDLARDLDALILRHGTVLNLDSRGRARDTGADDSLRDRLFARPPGGKPRHTH